MLRALQKWLITTRDLARNLKMCLFEVLVMLVVKEAELNALAKHLTPNVTNPTKAYTVKDYTPRGA